MKVIIIFAILGLSLAGLRGDFKKVGHFVEKHHQAIETGAEIGLKIGAAVAEASFVNVAGLIQDGIKTVGDVTQKKKNVGQLVEDGLKIVGDLTSKNGNTEELFSFGDALHDAGSVAGIVSTGIEVAGMFSFVDVDSLIQDGIKTVGDVTQKKKNVGQLIIDGLHIVGDLTSKNGNTEELFSFGDALHDAGDVAGIVGTGVKVAGMFAEDAAFVDVSDDELCYLPPQSDDSDNSDNSGNGFSGGFDGPIAFVNVAGLIQDGIKTVGDVTQKKKNVGQLIIDGLHIVGDLTSKNGNTEELFSFNDAIHDAGSVASIVGAGVEVAGLFA